MAEQKSEEEMLRWFEADLLPKLISENRFPIPGVEPSNLSKVTLKWEITADRNADHFASSPFFLHLTLCDAQKKETVKGFPLIVKFIPQNVALRAAMDVELQFYNEMVLYTQVLPTLKRFLESKANEPSSYFDELCPHCYYANIDLDNPDYGIIVLDDLRQIGYYPAASKVELDYNHCEFALKQLAKFHAVSYAMKLDRPEEFEALKTSYKECRYYENRYKEETMGVFHEMSGLRGINYLLAESNCEVPNEFLLELRKFFTSGVYRNITNLLTTPKEPLAVLAHGDFCRNNILFRLSNGVPNGCVLFDFATFRYSSPSVDLTFFFYLNTMQPFREKYFDQLLSLYHSTLIDYIATILSKTKEEVSAVYPLQKFYEDYSELSIYGYAIIAFFLPLMLSPEANLDLEDEFTNLTYREMAEKNVKIGGEMATKKIADVIRDMYQRKIQLERLKKK